MEAGGSKLEGKQASDGNQGGNGGEKGKKKEKKEKEKKMERVAKGSNGGQESQAGLNPGEKAKDTVTDPIPIPIRGEQTPEAHQCQRPAPTQGLDVIKAHCHPSTPGNPIPTTHQQLLRPLHLANQGLNKKVREGHSCRGMPPLSPGKGGLQFIPAHQATSGAVEGSNQSPRSSKGSIPRPFQRPRSSIHLGDIEATSYPLQTGPKFGTWTLPKMPSVAQNAKFANDVGVTPSGSIKVYHPLAGPPPQSIPWASALELIATPVNPLLDP
ncbi:hypothetical protein PAXRUDRAFT_22371 [Paxillus rubicundulus Ve08.2h10]|uniref:Uncharacterized protein n=1 Tax=Paxillus rubicundulus Ve08.2h10 TaxID=930991 RepID=A0A0D0CN89_9AGAM|nr:hypothetical protein PAXRUDRAFT_22371 [Paxillus rubicundulus Ve08.2h10]